MGAALGLLGAAVAVRDNVGFALALGGLALAILLLSSYRSWRRRFPASPLPPETDPSTRLQAGPLAIRLGPNVALDMKRVGIHGFPRAIDADDSAKITAEDTEITGPGGGTRPEPRGAGPVVGRNDPCPCGSGKKFKKCHGKKGR